MSHQEHSHLAATISKWAPLASSCPQYFYQSKSKKNFVRLTFTTVHWSHISLIMTPSIICISSVGPF